MKKLFTLVCGLFITLGMNAVTTLSSSFESWGEGCVVDGNTITYTDEWKGAKVWVGGEDYSDYDYLWVTFSESTCAYQLTVEYKGGTKNTTVEAIPGQLVVGVPLDQNYYDDVTQFYLKNQKTGGHLVITGVYVGTEKEFMAAKEGAKVEKSDLSLDKLETGWGVGTSYDAASHTIIIGEDWTGKGWWLDQVDYSDFDKVVVNFAQATATDGELVVEYNNNIAASSVGFAAGASSVTVALDATGKKSVSQIYVKGPENSKFVLESAYVCVNDYVETGIANVAVAPVGEVSEIYNLSGQKVGKSYKGIVIKNGKKFVQ